MSERPLAVIRSFDDLRVALRLCAKQRGVTRQELDRRAGLADGHTGKLLGRRAAKGFGRVSLTWLLEALNLELVLQERSEAAAPPVAIDEGPAPQDWRRNRGSAWGRRMAAHRHLSMTVKERRESARKAAQTRWQTRANPGEAVE